MRVPSGPIVPGTYLSLISGNQFQGPGKPGNQTEVGSAAFVRMPGAPGFTEVPMRFLLEDVELCTGPRTATCSRSAR